MQQPQVKIGEWIQRGFDLYTTHFVLLSVATLIAIVLSTVSLGLLAGPMYAGLILIVLALLDGKEPMPEIGDVFRGFDHFLQTFLWVLVWAVALIAVSFLLGLLPCIGPVLSFVVPFMVKAFLMFSLFLIVDRGLEFWPASVESYERIKLNVLPFLGFWVVVALIACLGVLACGVGFVLTLPVAICSLAVAYRDVFGRPGEGEPTPPPAGSPTDEGPESARPPVPESAIGGSSAGETPTETPPNEPADPPPETRAVDSPPTPADTPGPDEPEPSDESPDREPRGT